MGNTRPTMQKTLILSLVFLALVAAYPTSVNVTNAREWGLGGGPTGCTTSDTHFDYLLLVTQWPATQPSASWPAGADVSDFTLHGLWPSRTGADVNTYPCTCTSEQFSDSKVASVMDQMKAHWPSYTGNNDQFWSGKLLDRVKEPPNPLLIDPLNPNPLIAKGSYDCLLLVLLPFKLFSRKLLPTEKFDLNPMFIKLLELPIPLPIIAEPMGSLNPDIELTV